MARTIDIAQSRLFASDIFNLVQQQGSKLHSTGDVRNITGQAVAYFERLAPTEASEDSTFGGPTILGEALHSRRLCTPRNFKRALPITKEDELRMIIDPKGEYANNIANALGRKMDLSYIAALEGNATSVDNALGTSSVALVNTIGVAVGGADTDLNMEKVVEASRILMTNEVPEGEERFIVCDSIGYHALLKEVELSSVDFADQKSLVSGRVGRFMGFTFITSELLSSGTNLKRYLAYTRPALRIGLAQPVTVRMDERPDLNYLEQIWGSMSVGAVRMDEDRVIAINGYRA